MNIFLLILFLILGISGLFYNVDTGVFVGFGLMPWQVIRLRISKKINIIAILISTIIGFIYFAFINRNWVFLALFLFIMLYNYWGHKHTRTDQNEMEEI